MTTGPRTTRGPVSGRRGFLNLTTRQIVVAGLLGAITAIMGSVPYLGLIPLPFSPAGHATIMHVPVVLAAILEGPVVGALVGLIFGLFSFLQATLPFFKDPIIAFVPRILIGVFAYYAYIGVKHRHARILVTGALGLAAARTAYEAGLHLEVAGTGPWWAASCLVLGLVVAFAAWLVLRGENAPPAMAAIVGTLTNTVLVLGLIVVRHKVFTAEMAFFVGLTHGLPELIVAVIIGVVLYRAIKTSKAGRSA